MKKMTVFVTAIVALALAIGSTSAAATPPSTKASTTDKAWATKAVQIDLAEIKTGELAMKRASSAAVKKLGEKLARAHAIAGTEDKKLAMKIGATVPKAPNAKQKAVAKELEGMKGAAFDTAYAAAEVKGHLEAIKGAKAEIQKGSSQTVVQRAKMSLKMYEMHLKWARAALKAAEGGGGTM
jgi:putative membrane protein